MEVSRAAGCKCVERRLDVWKGILDRGRRAFRGREKVQESAKEQYSWHRDSSPIPNLEIDLRTLQLEMKSEICHKWFSGYMREYKLTKCSDMCTISDEYGVNTSLGTSFMEKEHVVHT